jgi:DNA (cytosine-5)-methyltransferase 1
MGGLKLLDLYCGGGGASQGYSQAGFHVTGVDIVQRKDYPFNFIKYDVLQLFKDKPLEWFQQFDLIHASPPCQAYSITGALAKAQGREISKIDHVDDVRDFLDTTGVDYVIENVVGSPLRQDAILCGSSFGLKVRRHRIFEATFPISSPPCRHKEQGKPVGVYGSKNDAIPGGGTTASGVEEASDAMGIKHMQTWASLILSIPPAYTKHIGEQWLNRVSWL